MLVNALPATQAMAAASTKVDIRPAVPEPGVQGTDAQSTRAAIDAANRAMRGLSNGLEFSLDAESGKLLVRVVDQATQQVIRQIPSEEMLSIARAIDRMRGLLLNRYA